MVNMKQSRKGDTLLAQDVASDAPEYPYGLRISLDADGLAKLGITDLPEVGQVMTLAARVEVVAVSQYEERDHTNRSVELQITDMDLKPEGAKTTEQSLYPNSNMR